MKKKTMRALFCIALIGLWFTPYGGLSVVLVMLWLMWFAASTFFNWAVSKSGGTPKAEPQQVSALPLPKHEASAGKFKAAWNNYLIGDWTLTDMVHDLDKRGATAICINATDDDKAFQLLIESKGKEHWIK